jgi:myosin-5
VVVAGLKKKTVAKAFSESLATLMEKLRATEHHYIRCLKPNQTLRSGDWDGDFMIKQLAYSGTLEVTQIRKAGLNVRKPLKHFYSYYKMCADDPSALRAGTVTKRTHAVPPTQTQRSWC